MPLPLLTKPPGSTFDPPTDQIWGLRGVKLDPDDQNTVLYQFVIDRPTNEEVFIHVDLDDTVRFTQTTPQDVLDQALVIARRLVRF